MTHASLSSLIGAQGLPEDFQNTVEQWYLPLLHQVVACKGERPLVLGVQGSQGSGKSTLALFLKLLAEQEHGLRAVELSIDDFYLTHAERVELASRVHPLFSTRGVPGTHDVALAKETIEALKTAMAEDCVRIPRFNKAVDDRYPESEWDSISGPVDIIIFEGWCVGCTAEPEGALAAAVNELEAAEDEQALWRAHVNQALNQEYKSLFALLDKLAVLVAPSFECVYDWRWLQEQKLVEKWQLENPDSPARLLNKDSVKRFISHYERLTRHCLNTLPEQADWVLPLDTDHCITDLICN